MSFTSVKLYEFLVYSNTTSSVPSALTITCCATGAANPVYTFSGLTVTEASAFAFLSTLSSSV